MLSYYCGKKVAYLEDEEYIDDLLKLDVYREEILDMYYYHDTDYYIDSITNNNSYEEYIFLRGKHLQSRTRRYTAHSDRGRFP